MKAQRVNSELTITRFDESGLWDTPWSVGGGLGDALKRRKLATLPRRTLCLVIQHDEVSALVLVGDRLGWILRQNLGALTKRPRKRQQEKRAEGKKE